MHEISLVQNIFATLKAEFPDQFDKIRTIYLTVGELSNVQPILMNNAFNAVLEDEPAYRHTKLEVEVVPVKVQCDYCNEISEVKQYKFICMACGSPCRNILQGEEMLISKVAFES